MTKEKRDFVYQDKAQTSIVLEVASKENPYVCEQRFLHGYDIEALANKRSFADTLLLLFTGELPKANQSTILNFLQISLITLGPRHPAVKAAMVAGVSKTNAEHLLPIGLSAGSGDENGAREVQASYTFILENLDQSPKKVAEQLLTSNDFHHAGEVHIAPGFGNHYGSLDLTSQAIANNVEKLIDDTDTYRAFTWANHLTQHLQGNNYSWLVTGLVAALAIDLGISARQSLGLYQLLISPGIYAHGVEQTHKPITAIPMPSDEQHVYLGEPLNPNAKEQ